MNPLQQQQQPQQQQQQPQNPQQNQPRRAPVSFAHQSQQLHQSHQRQHLNQTMEQQQQAILSGTGVPPSNNVTMQQQPRQPGMPQPPPQQQQQHQQPVQQQQPGQAPGYPQMQQQQQPQMMQQQQQQQQPQMMQQQPQPQQLPPLPNPVTATAADTATAIGDRLKGIFKEKTPEGPNFGFTPTAAMVQRHEDALVRSKRPTFQFQVTKLRNWRTGYVRILCCYEDHICTMDPDNHNPTNTWNYTQLNDYGAIKDKEQIYLTLDKDKLKLQCHNVDKSRVLSAVLEAQDDYQTNILAKNPNANKGLQAPAPLLLCNRWTRRGLQTPSALQFTPFGLWEVHPGTKKRLQIYRFVDIFAVSFPSDDPNGLFLHFSTKASTRLFSLARANARSELVTTMQQAYQRLGLELRMAESRTTVQWKQLRYEQSQSHTKSYTIATQYSVTKESKRHNAANVGAAGWPGGVVTRTLCLTGDGRILEVDPSDGSLVSMRPLQDLVAIVRPPTHGDQVVLEFSNGISRTYTSPARDSLLVSLLDAAATLGRNPHVHVLDVPSAGYNLASFARHHSSSKEGKGGGLFEPISIPMHCLRRVHSVSTAAFSYLNSTTESSTEEGEPINPLEECRNVVEVCREFQASVLPTAEGLPTTEKDKTILGSIGALWGLAAEVLEYAATTTTSTGRDRFVAEQTVTPMFQTLHRLSKTVAGYKHSIELATFLDTLPLLWTMEDPFTKFWAFRTLTVLVSGQTPHRDKEVEYVNKSVIFKAGGPRLIKGLVHALLKQEDSDLTRMVLSDCLQSVLCSFADTTSPEHFGGLIAALGENYQALLHTLYQQTPFVLENSALLLHLLSTHAPQVAAAIRQAALSSAILLHQLHAAIFSPLEGQRFLSRFLCSLWLAGPMDCPEKKLLKRLFPRGFLGYLKLPALSEVEEEQLDGLERDAMEENIPESSLSSESDAAAAQPLWTSSTPSGAAGTNTARLRSRIALATAIASKDSTSAKPENFRIFFHVLTQNHSLPDLIWNQQTRRELRIGLESEIQYIQRETEARGMTQIAWNHQQFGIDYPSLDHELRVGSVYMRLWLQAGEGFIKAWDEPLRLFELLFRRFLCEMDRNTKVTVLCIRCLERLYAIHGTTIGGFPDVMILIRSMASTRSTETQHRLLGLLATILGVQGTENGDESTINVPENAEQLLNTESIEQLCQFVAWGHTNGVQVGNLMTSVLGTSHQHSGRAMLTDGTTARPQGDGAGSSEPQETAAPDIACPAVWFVSSTGRIPPPPESVRGPFRVSELQRMMDEGDLSPFTLVTSTHVDSYDDEDDNAGTDSQVREEQIDTGKWKRLDQVWQLRWQLCTDGTGSGIYTPSQVAIRAIRSLIRLVDLHKSLDYRGLPYYPIPIAKRIMCGLSRDPFQNSGSSGGQQQDSFLSILSQSILCNDPQVVDQAAELLLKLTQYNEEATSKFYLTGIFFFVSCYTGSNFQNLAKLLHQTHLDQHFRSGFAAAADNSELPLKERSILGSLLPEGVLFILLNYGVERFNEVFVGNFDTPEVIWNFEMRKHLIEMVRQHLGDFPKRLWQNTTTKYEYCPMPGVAYKRLEREIFCHNYYLHNLCDEKRFPDWPISEPVEVFRACLEEFKKQVNRNETDEEEAIEKATKVLDLKPGDGSKQLRKAYRSLARLYHPDKNPGGREMFESIQSAYELLLPLVESGETIQSVSGGSGDGDSGTDALSAEGFAGGLLQMRAMQLLIRTQALLCRRFEKEMGKYKYPAYQILLSCLQLQPSCKTILSDKDAKSISECSIMSSARAEFVRDALELVYRTCLVSPLNAQELVAESGVVVMDELLTFYMEAAHSLPALATSHRLVSSETIAEILSNLVHTISGIAYYESGRAAISALAQRSQFCINWRRCIDGRYLGAVMTDGRDALIKRYALEGVAHMAKLEELQTDLIGSGIVWPLVRLLLGFDPTLDDAAFSRDSLDDDIGVSQASSNIQARLAARALGMLSGVMQDEKLASPKNFGLQKALDAMLTHPIALLLRNKRTAEILKTLNANVETPSRIWNVGMRNELVKFIGKIDSERPEDSIQPVSDELVRTSQFEYGNLKSELRIGGIYIRLFNQVGAEQGNLKDIPNPTKFAMELLTVVASSLNSFSDRPSGWIELSISDEFKVDDGHEIPSILIGDRKFLQVISALRILVRADGLIEDIVCNPAAGITPILLSLLELPQESETFEIGCDILTTLSPKQQFADAVAGQGSLWRLLWVLERVDSQESQDTTDEDASDSKEMLRKQRGWMLLESLSSSPSVASKIVESTAWLELLGILVGYKSFTKTWIARTGSAKTLSRLMWDPKTGPVIVPLLQRFLPATLIVVLKEEGADKMLSLFDGESDTPELIWDASMRSDLRNVLAETLQDCIAKRQNEGVGDESFVLGSTVRVQYKKLDDELFIGGVYVSRFLKEPTYNVRDPTKFLEMLMQRWTHELQLCTTSTSTVSVEQENNTTLAIGGVDALQSVTNASVYLCKVRPNLCDKLGQWGYMSRSLTFLEEVIDAELVGTPLLSVMRTLHVAVNRRTNVEALILSGKNDKGNGIVPFAMRAMGVAGLHKDVAFMLEMLKKLFVDALGDVQNASKGDTGIQRAPNRASYAMAPSPAPGEGPVSRNRVSAGNPMDDPLSMALGQPSSVPQQPLGNQAMGNMFGHGTGYQGQQVGMTQQPQYQVQQGGMTQQAQYQVQQGLAQGTQFQATPSYQSQNQGNFAYGSVSGGLYQQQQQQQYGQPVPQQQQQYGQPAPQQQQYTQQQPSVGYQTSASSPQFQNRFQTASSRMGQLAPSPYGQPTQANPQQIYNQQQVGRNTIPTAGGFGQPPMQSKPPQQHQRTTAQQVRQVSGGSMQGLQPTSAYGASSSYGGMQQNPGTQQISTQAYAPPSTASMQGGLQQPAIQQQTAGSSHYNTRAPGSTQWSSPQQVQQQQNQQQQAPQQHQQARTNPGTSAFGASVNGAQAPGQPQFSHQNLAQPVAGAPYPNSNAQVQPQQVVTVQEEPAPVPVDARQTLDPKAEAERRMKTSPPAPGAADGRVALLQSALLSNLPKFIVKTVLENSELTSAKDPAAAKVHGVELLKLLCSDPGFGMKFQLILDEIPEWKKYKSQDHSLFITGPEQKADYFLTDGSDGEPKKLLTQG